MDYIQIGQLKKTYGLEGELRMRVDDQYWEDLLTADVLFVDIKGQKIPFFIETIKDGDEILIKFEDLDDRDAAADISNKSLFLRTQDLIPAEQREHPLSDQLTHLIGYQIQTEAGQKIGPILELLEMPQQVLASVDYEKKEILIPLVDDFIVDIVEAEKKIIMTLPEGMLDL